MYSRTHVEPFFLLLFRDVNYCHPAKWWTNSGASLNSSVNYSHQVGGVSGGFQEVSGGFNGVSRVFSGFQGVSGCFRGFKGVSRFFHGVSRVFKEFQGFSRSVRGFQEVPWVFREFYGFWGSFKGFQGVWRIFQGVSGGLSWIGQLPRGASYSAGCALDRCINSARQNDNFSQTIDKRSIKMLTRGIVANFHSFIVQFHELILCQRGSIGPNLFAPPTFIKM